MKEIILFNNKGIALVDDADFDFVNQYKWHLHPLGYAITNVGVSKVLMHRLILGLTDPRIETDHINHVKLDNRRENIRACSHAENRRNCAPKNRCGYLGVSILRCKKRILYTARIRDGHETLYLGSYTTIEDAARSYDSAAKQKYGKFANLNFK